MATSIPNEINLRLDLVESSLHFKTELEFKAWLDNEVRRLQFLNAGSNLFPTVKKAYETLVAEQRKYVPGDARNNANLSPEQKIGQTLSVLKTLYDQKHLLEPNSKDDLFVREMAEQITERNAPEVILLFCCYALLCDNPPNQQFHARLHNDTTAAYIQAKFIINSYRSGDKTAEQALIESLNVTKSEWEKALRELHDTNKTKLDELNEAAIQQQESHADRRDEEYEDTQKLVTEFSDFITNSKEEWDNLKKTYDDELALKAPTTYWEDQRKKYRNHSWGFGALTLALIGFFGCIVTKVAKFEGSIKITDITVFHLTVLVLSTAVAIWIVQLCAKMFLSRFHLFTEASLRVLTIKTYLSLRKTGDADKETFNYMLQQVFKPLKTGLTKEKDITDNLGIIINALKK